MATHISSMSSGNRRRKYIVDPAFQWKWIASIMVIVFAISAMITVVTYGVLYQAVRTTTLHGERATLGGTTLSLVLCALGFAIVPALALGIWSIFVSHRVCGPMYAMEKDLREICEGRFPHQRPLRKKDHFKQFHAVLWRALTVLKKRDDSYRIALIEIEKATKASIDQPHGVQSSALSHIAAQLAPFVDDLGESLAASTESKTRATNPISRTSPPHAEKVETGC